MPDYIYDGTAVCFLVSLISEEFAGKATYPVCLVISN